MEILRTEDARFAVLRDYPYSPCYAEVGGREGLTLRMHYIDEGPRSSPVVLLLHGEPTWSYLYRNVVASLRRAGHRVIAPDLIGFGRSDKPSDAMAYTYESHVAWMREWLLRLDLADITLFCQDWGGLIGLRLVAAFPERFARVIAANTALPTGEGPISPAFAAWVQYSQTVPELPIGNIVRGMCARSLSDEEVAAYDAPFPTERHKAGARRFPVLVPTTPTDPSAAENRRAWKELERFSRPFMTAFSDGDPITRGAEVAFQQRIPGAWSQKHITFHGGGHFLQEDHSAEIAEAIATFTQTRP